MTGILGRMLLSKGIFWYMKSSGFAIVKILKWTQHESQLVLSARTNYHYRVIELNLSLSLHFIVGSNKSSGCTGS
jgi:hypothetical protein